MCGADLQISAEGVPISARWSDPDPTLGGNDPEYAIDAELRRRRPPAGVTTSRKQRRRCRNEFFRASPCSPSPSLFPIVTGSTSVQFWHCFSHRSFICTWRRGSPKTISDAPGTQSAVSRNIPLPPPAVPAVSAEPSTTESIPPGEKSSASPAAPPSE